MTAGIKVDVTPPGHRKDGATVTAAEIGSWRMATRAQGATDFTPFGGVNAPSVLSRTINGLADGTYDVQTIWTDSDGQDGDAAVASITLVTEVPAKAPLASGGMTLTQV